MGMVDRLSSPAAAPDPHSAYVDNMILACNLDYRVHGTLGAVEGPTLKGPQVSSDWVFEIASRRERWAKSRQLLRSEKED